MDEPQEVGQQDIKQAIETFRTESITHSNFDQFHERFESKNEIIESHVASRSEKLSKVMEEIDEIKETSSEKRWEDQDALSIELGKKYDEGFELMNDILTWRNLQRQMLVALVRSYNSALKGAKALDIQEEVMSEFRDIQKENREHFKELRSSAIGQVENVANTLEEDVKKDLRQIEERVDRQRDVVIDAFQEQLNVMAQEMAKVAIQNDDVEKNIQELQQSFLEDLRSNEYIDLKQSKQIEENIEESKEIDMGEETEEIEDDQDPVEVEESPEMEVINGEDEEEEEGEEQKTLDESDEAVEMEDEEEEQDIEPQEEHDSGGNGLELTDEYFKEEIIDIRAKEAKKKIEESPIINSNREILERLLELEENWNGEERESSPGRKTVTRPIKDALRE